MSFLNFMRIAGAASVLSCILIPTPAHTQRGQVVAQVQGDSTKPLIEIRLASTTPTAGFSEMADPTTSRPIFVSGDNTFSDSDFLSVRAQGAPNGLVLNAEWKPEAADRFARMLRGELGSGNDIMAVFVNGELVNAPAIVRNARANAPPSVIVNIAVPVANEKVRGIREAIAVKWPGMQDFSTASEESPDGCGSQWEMLRL